VSPRFARHEGMEDQDHEPTHSPTRFVTLIFHPLVTVGPNGRPAHTNTAPERRRREVAIGAGPCIPCDPWLLVFVRFVRFVASFLKSGASSQIRYLHN
jgi:hypothetical protein